MCIRERKRIEIVKKNDKYIEGYQGIEKMVQYF